MKKICLLFVLFTIVFILSGCKEDKATPPQTQDNISLEDAPVASQDKNGSIQDASPQTQEEAPHPDKADDGFQAEFLNIDSSKILTCRIYHGTSQEQVKSRFDDRAYRGNRRSKTQGRWLGRIWGVLSRSFWLAWIPVPLLPFTAKRRAWILPGNRRMAGNNRLAGCLCRINGKKQTSNAHFTEEADEQSSRRAPEGKPSFLGVSSSQITSCKIYHGTSQEELDPTTENGKAFLQMLSSA